MTVQNGQHVGPFFGPHLRSDLDLAWISCSPFCLHEEVRKRKIEESCYKYTIYTCWKNTMRIKSVAADTCDSLVLTCENKDPNWCHVSSVIYKFNIKGKITRSDNKKLFHKNKLLHMCKCNCNNSTADPSSVPCFSASLLSPLLSLHAAAALQFAVTHTNTNHIRTYKWMWRDCSCCPAASLAAAPHHWLYWLLYCTLIYILWECHRKGAAPLSTRYIKIMMSTSNWIVNIIGVQRYALLSNTLSIIHQKV